MYLDCVKNKNRLLTCYRNGTVVFSFRTGSTFFINTSELFANFLLMKAEGDVKAMLYGLLSQPHLYKGSSNIFT